MKDEIIQALCTVGEAWLDTDYPVREDAVERTLSADNRFTEAAIAFAVNQQMSLLSKEALLSWQSALGWNESETIGVLNPGNIPFVELQDFLAVILSGRTYVGTVSSKSPALFPAFLADLLEECPAIAADLTDLDDVIESCDRLIAAGSDETMAQVRSMLEREGKEVSESWFRGHRFSVAVLHGRESEDDLVGLAEDALLHEALGCRNVSIIFAPASMPIDPVLDALAAFRGLFEAHDSTKGTLNMQQAFLGALKVPHAFADDHQFLLSRGEAETQQPGHLRWVPIGHQREAEAWIAEHSQSIQSVFSNVQVSSSGLPVGPLGTAQRPPLDWSPDGRSHIQFFRHFSVS